jgi:FAD synthase
MCDHACLHSCSYKCLTTGHLRKKIYPARFTGFTNFHDQTYPEKMISHYQCDSIVVGKDVHN